MTDKATSYSSSILLLFIPLRSVFLNMAIFPFLTVCTILCPWATWKQTALPQGPPRHCSTSESLSSKDEELDVLSVSTSIQALQYELCSTLGASSWSLRRQHTDPDHFPTSKRKTPFLSLFCFFFFFNLMFRLKKTKQNQSGRVLPIISLYLKFWSTEVNYI